MVAKNNQKPSYQNGMKTTKMPDFVIQGNFCNKNQNKLSFSKQFDYLVLGEKVINFCKKWQKKSKNNSSILSYIFNYAVWMLKICSNSLNRGSPVLWKYPKKALSNSKELILCQNSNHAHTSCVQKVNITFHIFLDCNII